VIYTSYLILLISDLLAINATSNITFFFRTFKNDSEFISRDYKFFKDVTITPDTFSLLKFPNQESDFSLDCLAANLTATSEYITVFPVKCSSKIANAYFCSCKYLECGEKSVEQMDMLFSPVFSDDMVNGIMTETNQVKKTIKNLDPTKAFESIFKTLWYSGLPCFDLINLTANNESDRSILKYCEWKGLEIPCSEIFSTFPTDRGMCCSFNMKAAEEIFNGQIFPKLVQDLQVQDKNNSFNKVLKHFCSFLN